MFGEPNTFGVKICGITTEAQAFAIADLGADAIGLNFWPRSKRYLDPAQAAAWAPALKAKTTAVAVLVNADAALIEQASTMVHMLQLHGDETPADVERVMALGLPVIKALQVRDESSLAQIDDYPCELILLDAWCPGGYGGEGKTFPWQLAIEAKERFPHKRLILAGGLTPDNVAAAAAQVLPVGVDVASGVESAPGVKDLSLVQQFIVNARH